MSRIVMITGASGGIGLAVAAGFSQNGDKVALGSFSHPEKAARLLALLERQGGQGMVVQGDISDPEQVDSMFRQVEDGLGPVDILVNSAGIEQQKLFCEITPEEWDRMFAVHVKGSYLCARRALPDMLRQKNGIIVNMSSIWGQVGGSCEVHYSAAKAAVEGMTKALAKEMAPSGIRVNCVAPGAVDTAMMEKFSGEEVDAFCEGVPLGRMASPKEIADVVQFLCSGGASYITGQVVSPNGGMA